MFSDMIKFIHSSSKCVAVRKAYFLILVHFFYIVKILVMTTADGTIKECMLCSPISYRRKSNDCKQKNKIGSTCPEQKTNHH